MGLATAASAGEYELPTLRGSSPFVPASPAYARWSGFYFGGHVGAAHANVNFGNAAGDLIANILRHTRLESEFHPSEWSNLPRGHDRSGMWGGFAGYNTQWEDAVIGVDATYNRLSLAASSTDAISRIVTMDDFNYAVTVISGANYSITDLATFRFRGGWAFGQFMPYATAGVAVARGSYFKFASVGYPEPTYALPPPIPPEQPPPTPPAFGPVTESSGRTNAYIFGYAFGGGADFAIMPNVFLRAEYEFVMLPVSGMKMQLHTGRVGGGIKF
jgi:opacity protein-like surface antigen